MIDVHDFVSRVGLLHGDCWIHATPCKTAHNVQRAVLKPRTIHLEHLQACQLCDDWSHIVVELPVPAQIQLAQGVVQRSDGCELGWPETSAFKHRQVCELPVVGEQVAPQ